VRSPTNVRLLGFLISEEDKRNPTSIDYWFRCVDLDNDGLISMFELEYFYENQATLLGSMKADPATFSDFLCQTCAPLIFPFQPLLRHEIMLHHFPPRLDMVNPAGKNVITSADLKKCKVRDSLRVLPVSLCDGLTSPFYLSSSDGARLL